MKKNLLLIGRILGGFVSGCIVTFAIVLGLTTFLGLTGCSMNVAPTQMFEESTQNKIEWIVTDDESRGIYGTDVVVGSLVSVTLEIYRVPVREHKYIKDEMELTEVRTLQRGESFSVPSAKDYKYEFATYVRCIEFNNGFTFYDVRNEINFFDYEGDIVMEIVQYRGGSLKQSKNFGIFYQFTDIKVIIAYHIVSLKIFLKLTVFIYFSIIIILNLTKIVGSLK